MVLRLLHIIGFVAQDDIFVMLECIPQGLGMKIFLFNVHLRVRIGTTTNILEITLRKPFQEIKY